LIEKDSAMVEEKNSSLEPEVPETAAEDKPEQQQITAEEAEEEQQVQEAVSQAQKRGRMIAGGLVTAVIVSLIAVLVAGIFQVSSRWLRPCSTDLPVNDPSPKLWQEMVSQNVTIQTLGVPETVSTEAQFKGSAPVPKESGTNTEAKEGN
jgi:hypothetical protein